jgi:hypothetical protein
MFRAPSRRGTGQALASRIGAFLFLGGAGLTVLAPLLPHPEQMDIAGFMAIAAL